MDRGELAGDLVPDDVATVLIALADGLQLQWLLAPDRVNMERLLSKVWESLKPFHEAPAGS